MDSHLSGDTQELYKLYLMLTLRTNRNINIPAELWTMTYFKTQFSPVSVKHE